MKTIKLQNILVPFDKTDVSANALKYALRCYPDANIIVVHIKSNLDSIDDYQVEGQLISNEEYWNNDLSDFIIKELKLSELPRNVSLIIKYGNIVDKILLQANNSEVDHIVMGTRDNHTVFDKWIGSVSLGVIKRSKQSITLVPRYSKFKLYEKVMVASDQSLKNKTIANKILDWNQRYQAYIKFIHVTNRDNAFLEEKTTIVETFFENSNPDFGFEITLLKGTDVVESLLATAYNFGADMLIAMPADETYIHTLLFKSISKELLEKSKIPVLFLK